jgi:hypothetical protein
MYKWGDDVVVLDVVAMFVSLYEATVVVAINAASLYIL